MTDLSPAIAYSIEHAREIFNGKAVLALTGAGISTDSGIPDYRGEGRVQKHPLTFDQFINGLDETYLHEYHRYQLAANHDREEVVNFVKSL